VEGLLLEVLLVAIMGAIMGPIWVPGGALARRTVHLLAYTVVWTAAS